MTLRKEFPRRANEGQDRTVALDVKGNSIRSLALDQQINVVGDRFDRTVEK